MKKARRELLERAIVRGGLLAGVPATGERLLEMLAERATSAKETAASEVGPFYKKGAPGNTKLRQPGDAGVRYWDAENGIVKRTVALTKTRLRIAAQSDDGTRAATADRSGEIRVWDLKHGELLKVLTATNPRASDKRLDALQFSHDGKRRAGAGRERRVRIFDLETGREAMSLADGVGEDAAIAFSRHGDLVAAPNSDTKPECGMPERVSRSRH